MVKIEIMSIQDLLHIPNLRDNEKCSIIFITTKPDYYSFGNTDFYILNIADTEAPVITSDIVNEIKWVLERHEYYKTIYVCCDAGLSRSPAIAHFLAVRVKEYEQAEEIEKKYRFLNQVLYERLMEMM